MTLNARLAEAILRNRWVAIALVLGLTAIAASGLPRLEFESNYRYFFSPDNPDLQAFDAFQAIYSKNDNIFFVLRDADAEAEVFTPEVIDAVEALTARAWTIPYATRVDSVTNYQHSVASGDTIVVADLVRDGAQLSHDELARLRNTALGEPSLVGNLISADGRTAGVNVTIQFPEKDPVELKEAVAVARAIADDLRAGYPELRIGLAGIAMINNGFVEAGEADAKTLIPAMYGLILVLSLIGLRSLSGTVVTLIVIALSTVVALGAAGHLGIKLAPIAIAAPNVILTIAVADCIHIVAGFQKALRTGLDKIASIKLSLSRNMTPVFVTSLTTIIGFLSLNFSDAPPFRALGNITAFGIAAAWMFSILLLPAVLSFMPLGKRGHTRPAFLEQLLSRLADFVIARRNSVLLAGAITSLAMVGLAATNQFNDQFLEYFDHRLELRRDLDFSQATLQNTDLMEFSVAAAGPGGINDPDYLRDLEMFTAYLRGRSDVNHVLSYADTVKRLNRNMHGDEPEWYRLPERSDLAAQYLLVYELSLPLGLDLNDRISIDKSATRVTAQLDRTSAAEQRRFIEETANWLRQNTPSHMWTKATGVTAMMDYVSLRNAQGMVRGNVLAIALIAITMMFTFRSIRIGLLSIIPNAIPALVAFGVWALLFGMIGMAASVILATSLGVVVDDTVHFLSKYLHARRQSGLSRADSVRYAFRMVGDAIVMTSIILAAGFGLLAFSAFGVNSQLGLLTSIAVIAAAVFDFTILPALLLLGGRAGETLPERSKNNVPETA